MAADGIKVTLKYITPSPIDTLTTHRRLHQQFPEGRQVRIVWHGTQEFVLTCRYTSEEFATMSQSTLALSATQRAVQPVVAELEAQLMSVWVSVR